MTAAITPVASTAGTNVVVVLVVVVDVVAGRDIVVVVDVLVVEDGIVVEELESNVEVVFAISLAPSLPHAAARSIPTSMATVNRRIPRE